MNSPFRIFLNRARVGLYEPFEDVSACMVITMVVSNDFSPIQNTKKARERLDQN